MRIAESWIGEEAKAKVSGCRADWSKERRMGIRVRRVFSSCAFGSVSLLTLEGREGRGCWTHENYHAVACGDGCTQRRHDGIQQRMRAGLDIRYSHGYSILGGIFPGSDQILVRERFCRLQGFVACFER